MTPVSSLQPNDVTRELVDLIAKAGPDERRVLHYSVTGVASEHVSRNQLTETMATLPEDEARLQLYLARRVCGLGMDQYGPLDLSRDRRDLVAESCAEDVDGSVYRICDVLRGRDPDRLLRDSVDLMRRSLAAAIRVGSV